jgi:hypothetical protein
VKDSFFVDIYRTADGVPYAISMRADYRAEHQYGIDELLLSVGARPGSEGLDRWRVSPGKEGVVQAREGHVYGWRVGRKAKLRATLLVGVPLDLNHDFIVEVADRDKPLNGAWSGKNFILSGRDVESATLLREIAREAHAGNVLVYQGMNPVDPASGGSLMLLIESKTPPDVLMKIVEFQERHAA